MLINFDLNFLTDVPIHRLESIYVIRTDFNQIIEIVVLIWSDCSYVREQCIYVKSLIKDLRFIKIITPYSLIFVSIVHLYHLPYLFLKHGENQDEGRTWQRHLKEKKRKKIRTKREEKMHFLPAVMKLLSLFLSSFVPSLSMIWLYNRDSLVQLQWNFSRNFAQTVARFRGRVDHARVNIPSSAAGLAAGCRRPRIDGINDLEVND